ncbi:transposase [Achromobacter xylosoxidans]|uniref:Transposase n=1 Tax=Alcaligenes xylosoxydans xylosoxydans TaxID=85698 RepID=A0A1R1K2V8_ALCXX|nr:transposase [Achromobacter xylosoxidans]
MQAKLSITRACQIAGLSRAAYYKKPMPASERDAQVIDALNAIVTRHGRWGLWKCLAIEVGVSIPSARLVRVLSRLIDCYGPTDAIRLDNGPERISEAFTQWVSAKGIAIRYIQPGKPNQNAFIERFNRTYRTEVLDARLSANLEQVQAITGQWPVDYNQYRPHESLGGLPPVPFMPRLTLAPMVYQPMST